MPGITTLELSVILVVAAGAAAGVAASLVVRRQRSMRARNLGVQALSEDQQAVSGTSSEEPDEFLDFDSDPVPAARPQEESVGQPTASSTTTGPAPSVTSFQAEIPQPEPIQSAFASEPMAATESPALDERALAFEVSPADEIEQTVHPLIEQSPVTPQAVEEPSAHTGSIALPTDSAAIESMTPAPAFPVAPQAASLGTIASNTAPQANGSAPSAYCVKCKSKKQMKDPTSVTMKNGRAALSGYCSDCGTHVFRIGKLSPTTPL